jgi:1-aminocyclopropane-1-carboxylate deaminase/D-cysteine desulfhydrase-like pyridoxal-dependent ACC family enzyme
MIHTPIEKVSDDIWVKREDLSCPPPGPPFAKIRGLDAFLRKNTNRVIGYTETQISMAGWGVAFLCQQLHMKCVIFYPEYKTVEESPERLVLDFHKEKWKEFGAILYPMKAGRLRILHYMAAKILREKYGDKALMVPLYIPLSETTEEVSKEVASTVPIGKFKSIVVCVGSGVMLSGILRGLSLIGEDISVYGVFIRHHNDVEKKRIEIIRRSNILFGGNFKLINTDYEYLQAESIKVPFPCNKFYDAKAWRWLIDHQQEIEHPILFWSIGADGMKTGL